MTLPDPTRRLQASPSGLMNRGQLLAYLGISKRILYRLMDQNVAPPHIFLGSRRFWRVQSVDAWLEKKERRAERARNRALRVMR